ncbi:hypothetical protein WA026_007166 [Henosepilachna vigintioctopunctata]|uniref:Uncharacterized protein n=1 Tax=Henosepilachna vigintioctopunctata TaxID=420089 RepID=A0AAW1V3E5_9CUCU
MMKILLPIFVLLCSYCLEADAIVCLENACDNVICKQIDKLLCKEPKFIIRGGGSCGCCEICYSIAGPGEFCGFPILLGVPPPPILCRPDLQCKNGVCQKRT